MGTAAVAFAYLPYVLVAGAYAVFVGGGLKDFGIALSVVIAARLFFSVIEGLSGILKWRLFGRRVMVDKFLRWLRSNKLPPRYYQHDDFCNYLARVEDDIALPSETRFAAKHIYAMLTLIEDFGTLAGARAHAATEDALEIYSPRSNAPIYSPDMSPGQQEVA